MSQVLSTDGFPFPAEASQIPQDSALFATQANYIGSLWRIPTRQIINQFSNSTLLVTSEIASFDFAVYQNSDGGLRYPLPKVAEWTHLMSGLGAQTTDITEFTLQRGVFWLLFGRTDGDLGADMRMDSWGARDMRLVSQSTATIVGTAPSSLSTGSTIAISAPAPVSIDPSAQSGAGNTGANDIRTLVYRMRRSSTANLIVGADNVIVDADNVVAEEP